MRAWPTCCAVVLVAIGVSCGSPSEPGGAIQERTSAVTSCSSHTVQVVDLQSDFRDIWAGRETTATGKQADPAVQVTLDFNTTVQPSLVSGQFVPAVTDGSCGGTVAIDKIARRQRRVTAR